MQRRTFFLLLAPAAFAQKGPVTDDTIFDRVRLKLASDPDVRGGALDVAVKDGVVTLKGRVDKESYKQRAERLTKKIKGVKSVVNQLLVEPRVGAAR
ncbi:MAG: BON domain-containing protein [Bryobacteraceae bacterium]|nr:BON domain-containing protein [Bryobacteraceae bacterium]